MTAVSGFHAGERAMQGEDAARMASIGQRVIRDHLPDQHRAFYVQLPALFVGTVDPTGAPWASLLVGLPGFVRSPDARTLVVRAPAHRGLVVTGDPLGDVLAGVSTGARPDLAVLGIELETRRRNRAAGRVTAADRSGFTLAVEETVGNCPQYIHRRAPRFARDPWDVTASEVVALDTLDAEAVAMIRAADTLFVASWARPAGEHGGADISHRGGPPGFVRVEDERTLRIPDYPGNSFYMSLGNLVAHPFAGLLFVDFSTGDLLQLTGRAEVLAGSGGDDAMAERAWRVRVTGGRRLRGACPLRWAGLQ